MCVYFLNELSSLRLTPAILMEIVKEWEFDREYLQLDLRVFIVRIYDLFTEKIFQNELPVI